MTNGDWLYSLEISDIRLMEVSTYAEMMNNYLVMLQQSVGAIQTTENEWRQLTINDKQNRSAALEKHKSILKRIRITSRESQVRFFNYWCPFGFFFYYLNIFFFSTWSRRAWNTMATCRPNSMSSTKNGTKRMQLATKSKSRSQQWSNELQSIWPQRKRKWTRHS